MDAEETVTVAVIEEIVVTDVAISAAIDAIIVIIAE